MGTELLLGKIKEVLERKVLERMVGMVPQQCERTERYWTVHLKMVQMVSFLLCAWCHSLTFFSLNFEHTHTHLLQGGLPDC